MCHTITCKSSLDLPNSIRFGASTFNHMNRSLALEVGAVDELDNNKNASIMIIMKRTHHNILYLICPQISLYLSSINVSIFNHCVSYCQPDIYSAEIVGNMQYLLIYAV